jgi:transcriptional regulator GlxA family with amidase domain
VTTAVQTLIAHNGALTIDHAAASAGTSARHLERLFNEQVGMSPKRFGRVLRFQAAAAEIATEPTRPLVDVSADTGYFDQAHMIREFVSLAGSTPGQFQRSLGALTRAMLA